MKRKLLSKESKGPLSCCRLLFTIRCSKRKVRGQALRRKWVGRLVGKLTLIIKLDFLNFILQSLIVNES